MQGRLDGENPRRVPAGRLLRGMKVFSPHEKGCGFAAYLNCGPPWAAAPTALIYRFFKKRFFHQPPAGGISGGARTGEREALP